MSQSRSAHASIRGYLYQSLLGVLRWLELEEGDALLCEGDEDLDRLLRDGTVIREQVKYSGSPVSAGDEVVRKTLRGFLAGYAALPDNGTGRVYLLTTNAAYQERRRGPDPLAALADLDRRKEAVAWLRGMLGEDSKTLGWYEKAPERWDGFVESVRVEMGGIDLDGVRDTIVERLAAPPFAIPSNHRQDASARLLEALFRASSEPEVAARLLTTDRRADLIAEIKNDIAAGIASPDAGRLLDALAEEKALRPLLDHGYRQLGERKDNSRLLVAQYEVIPFQEEGRQEELAALDAWCAADTRPSAWLWTGEGGTGKTRLLIEWCRRLRHQGWHAGFLHREVTIGDLAPLFAGRTPRLLVIDYAETRLEVVRALLSRLGRDRDDPGPRVRIALLARRAGAWWKELVESHRDIDDLIAESPDQRQLTPLVPAVENRANELRRGAEGYAAVLGTELPRQFPTIDLSDVRYERALYLHMAALLLATTGELPVAEQLLQRVLDRERRLWRYEIEDLPNLDASLHGWLLEAVERSVVALTLAGGARERAGAEALIALAAPDPPRSDLPKTVSRLLERLYGGGRTGERHVDPLEPDLLGEELVSQTVAKGEDFIGRLLTAFDLDQARNAIVVMSRLLVDGRLPVPIVERVLALLDTHFQETVQFREAAVIATELMLASHRAAYPQPEGDARRNEARFLNNRSNRLAALGRREEALASIEEAVKIRRELARGRQDAFLRHLAGSLNNLSSRLADLGRHEDAIEAVCEAVEILRELARERRSAFLPELAMSLSNLCSCLAHLGRHAEAVTAVEEAVAIRRGLARARPDLFLPDLAMSLNNLSGSLAELGRLEEGLMAIGEAVEIRRELAHARPDAFLPGFAMSLNNLCVLLADLGSYEGALEAIKQAVAIYLTLARTRPDAFLPDLALFLNNLSNRLADLDRDEEALEASEEAVRVHRELATARPDVFLPDLALSLHNLSSCLGSLGRIEEGLTAIEEAVEIRRDLACARPHAVQPDLAGSLFILSFLLFELDSHKEALAAGDEAIRTMTPYFLQQPATFAARIRTGLENYLKFCEELGIQPDGDLLAPIFEALAELDA